MEGIRKNMEKFPEDKGVNQQSQPEKRNQQPRNYQPEKYGYNQNEGQNSSANRNSTPDQKRGGMNYGSGENNENSAPGTFKNYDAPLGGYNEEREYQTFRDNHSVFRDLPPDWTEEDTGKFIDWRDRNQPLDDPWIDPDPQTPGTH